MDGARHISSFVGLEASENKPQSILAGDRNVYNSPTGDQDLTWGKSQWESVNPRFDVGTMHGGHIYILLADASVHLVNSAQLAEHISAALAAGDTNATVTLSLPRGTP